MSRLRVLLPPARERLGRLPVNVVVRDWPETLALFRERGLDPLDQGGAPLGELLPALPLPGEEGTPSLAEAILEAMSWRRG